MRTSAAPSAQDASRQLQAAFDRWRGNRESLRVLEAGCGSTTRLDLGPRAHLTGLDISPSQLARNTSVHERILGDLQSFPIPTGAFDVAVCWDVLEHLDQPAAAVRNMSQALRPGGVLVLAVPNLWSIKGIVTKLTPFRLHVAFYRHALGDRRVGTDAGDQFPTCLRLDVSPPRLRALARQLGLRARFEAIYEGPVQGEWRHRSCAVDVTFAILSALSRLATGRTVDVTGSDYLLVLERPA